MIITLHEFLNLLQGASFCDEFHYPKLKTTDWLFENYSFADDGAHYLRGLLKADEIRIGKRHE